jgi:6-phosphogluconate dehydrogenase
LRVGLIGNELGLARTLHAAGLATAVHRAGTTNADGLDRPGVKVASTFAGLSGLADPPRFFLLDLPVGGTIDAVVDEAYLAMAPGDVILDPTGSYWGDTLRRFRRMRHRALFYVDLALIGAMPGGTVLAAGDARALELARALLEPLARPGGVIRAGAAGAAHYALMVHEAVATAAARAASEAQQLMEAFPNAPEAGAVLRGLWPEVPSPGARAAWLLDDAVRLQASIPLLAQSVMLEIGQALDEQRVPALPPRVQGFVHPDEIL